MQRPTQEALAVPALHSPRSQSAFRGLHMRARLLLFAVTLPATLAAQSPRIFADGELDLQGGLSALYFRPQGQLASLIGHSGGYGAHGLMHASGTPFSLRFDYRRVIYGAHTYQRRWYDHGKRESVDVDSSVSNNIRSFLIGPQLTLPFGPIRPYVGIAVGGSVASTEWDVEEHRASDDAESTCNDDDDADSSTICIGNVASELLPNIGQILGGHWSGSFTRTIGLVIPFTIGRSLMAIDIGVTEHRNGRTSLKREGDQRRYRSDLAFRTIQIGVTLQ